MRKYVGLFAIIITAYLTAQAGDPEVSTILESVRNIPSVSKRTLAVSEHLLERKYVLGNCGEGDAGCYDTDPVFRLDQFDCTTFVETVLAFAFVSPKSQTAEQDFFHTIKDIRYVDAEDVCYVNRNHFTELNWIPNAVSKKYLKDITLSVDPGAPTRTTWLNVDKWYQDKIDELEDKGDPDKEEKISELSKAGENKSMSTVARLPFVTLAHLVSKKVQDKLKRKKIVVFNLVKHRHSKLNVPTIVGHQGFIIEKNGELFLRHATPAKDLKKTADVPFEAYILERMKDTTWPTLGMNLMEIQETRP